MTPLSKLALLPASLLAGAFLLVTAVQGPAGPKEKESSPAAVYDSDRDHLWNRVHEAFYTRTGPDDRPYGTDRLEPLLWSDSKHLLDGKSAGRAVSVLEEFLREQGETLIDDPLKRATLQRDLWLVFNWLAKDQDVIDQDPARKRLGVPLATVIRRLALTPEQIAKLPDNYAAAVASKRYADRFDPEKPERAYLPPDLFKPDGPWVCFGRTDAPPASQHIDESGTNRFTNSVFLVFLKLPGGREKTLEWVKRMAVCDKPLLLDDPADTNPSKRPTIPNPDVPQLPKGTEVAFVRRALLVDSRRRVVASPLTESVQVRVMRVDSSSLKAEDLKFVGNARDSVRRGFERQSFFEFQLRRADLFAEDAGALRDVSAEERDFKTGFASHGWDEFEAPPRKDMPFPERAQPFDNTRRRSCLGCHFPPGVHGLKSLQRMKTLGEKHDNNRPPYPLAEMKVNAVEQAVVKWKEERPGWKALRKLLPE